MTECLLCTKCFYSHGSSHYNPVRWDHPIVKDEETEVQKVWTVGQKWYSWLQCVRPQSGSFWGSVSTGIRCQELPWSVEEAEGAPSVQQGANSKYSRTWPLRHTYKFKEGTDVHSKGLAVLDAKTSPLLDYICQKQWVWGIYFIPFHSPI